MLPKQNEDHLCYTIKNFTYKTYLIIEASITINKNLKYDSKEETGFVGIYNAGTTCYMNSFL